MKLRGPVFEDKVVELIKSKAKIVTKILSKEDLLKLFNNTGEDSKEKKGSDSKTKKKEDPKKTSKK